MLNLSSEITKVYKVSYPVFRASKYRPVAEPGRNGKGLKRPGEKYETEKNVRFPVWETKKTQENSPC